MLIKMMRRMNANALATLLLMAFILVVVIIGALFHVYGSIVLVSLLAIAGLRYFFLVFRLVAEMILGR